jgi:hypothetical protein
MDERPLVVTSNRQGLIVKSINCFAGIIELTDRDDVRTPLNSWKIGCTTRLDAQICNAVELFNGVYQIAEFVSSRSVPVANSVAADKKVQSTGKS